ncbi:MAG: hypothetical protein JWQ02_1373 [Capsulimonas sp.]|nr:hypothetical protein [Capsulimonas sp.]
MRRRPKQEINTDASDAYMCANLLCFMMAFDWETFVMRGDQKSILRMDDAIIWLVRQDPEKDGQADEIFDALGVFERDLDSLPDIPAFGRFWSRSPRPENGAEHAE